MKKIYYFILKSFIGPFVVTFTIAMVFLIMQFLWKYVDDIMGKDVGMLVILKLLFYTSANIIPMALPIAILFSSIMTMGNLAETNELTAMKSSGISLFRMMRPMVVFVVFIAIGTFYFSNYILPIANLKQRALIYDLQQKKTTFYIPEGIFYNDIDGLSLKVDSKDEETGVLNGVLIYTNNPARTIRSERGEMIFSDNNDYLFLKLSNGAIYEESSFMAQKNDPYPYSKTFFKETILKFDFSNFNLQKTDENLYKRDFEMMNFLQLDRKLDTIIIDFDSIKYEFKKRVKNEVFVLDDRLNVPTKFVTRDTALAEENMVNDRIIDSIFTIQEMSDLSYSQALKLAQVNIRARKDFSYNFLLRSKGRNQMINDYKVAWHQKFTLSFAVIVLFFVGAPLGAIVKKGGLGLPLILATVLFLFYYIITITGENLVESNVLTPFYGIWLSAFFLVPVGVFLSIQSANESALFDVEVYKQFFKKFKSK
ncbi:permease [Putridiphycobacter roseus]|uniref:Permease n=1 Tax=Putridiphycobacter roseus TaxID=2219161 RepID=A0A2W1N4H7_9FLAO|nr:LptF/LptG family permease [Putridiphycobacter roseus]PZE18490.1 permease [Putridiphycobacter roseus]